MTWRDNCRPIIAKVIAENPSLPLKELRAKLREAYPFNQRLCHPYKIWCDEVRVQLGLKPVKVRKAKPKSAPVESAGQSLFGEAQ